MTIYTSVHQRHNSTLFCIRDLKGSLTHEALGPSCLLWVFVHTKSRRQGCGRVFDQMDELSFSLSFSLFPSEDCIVVSAYRLMLSNQHSLKRPLSGAHNPVTWNFTTNNWNRVESPCDKHLISSIWVLTSRTLFQVLLVSFASLSSRVHLSQCPSSTFRSSIGKEHGPLASSCLYWRL